MKKTTTNLHRWITAILLLSLSSNTFAQNDNGDAIPPCQSVWEEYTLLENHSIVRSNYFCSVIHLQYDEPNTGMTRHTFLVDDYLNNDSIAFSTYFNSVDSTDYYVYIYDMELYNNVCFFCGTLIHKTLDIFSNEYVHEGFVGFFTASSVSSGGDIVYYIVPSTYSLTRLAIGKPNNGIVKIHAIGTSDNSGTACLAEITCTSYLNWTATLNHLTDQPLIVFSDICSTRDSVILLAQNKCANDIYLGHSGYDFNHQIIMLDRFTHNGCYYDYNAVPIHYMAFYYFDDDEECNFHYDRAKMGLCPVYDNHFGAAFAVREDPSNHQGIRYFSFPHIWQFDSSIYYRMGSSTALKDLSYNLTLNDVLILSRDNNHTDGVVTIPSMGNTAHSVTQLTTPDYILNSLSMRGASNFLNISGHNASSYFCLLSQDIDRMNLNTCFGKTTKTATLFPMKQAARIVATWKEDYYDKEFKWIKAEIIPDLKISIDTVCEKCHNDR